VRYAIHVDMDAFFASIEQRANPALRGKPVIVGGRPGSRSAVAAASYEARRFGVHSGMPTSEAERLCPQAIFLPGNSSHYVHTSVQLYRILREFSPRVEPASIDEAYVDALVHGDVTDFGRRIMRRIETQLGLTASLGISDSKYLAKVGSAFSKPRGLTMLMRSDVPLQLWPRPVSCLYGVGEKTREKLAHMGCTTVGDLARMPVTSLERRLGQPGVALWHRARGEDNWRIVTPNEAPDARSIGHEHTLHQDVYDRSRIEAVLCDLCERVSRRARRANMGGRRLVLKLRDPSFNTTTHGQMLPRLIDSAEDLFATARVLLQQTRFWRRGVRLLGVSLQKLSDTQAARQLCFDFDRRSQRTSPVVDSINRRYGDHAIGLGRSLEAKRRRRGGSDFPSFRPPPVPPATAVGE
jgi:DNA polymerase-4